MKHLIVYLQMKASLRLPVESAVDSLQ